MLLLIRDPPPTEDKHSEDSPSSSAVDPSSEMKSAGDSHKKDAAKKDCDKPKQGEGEGKVTVLELLEECLGVMTGSRCKALQAGPPSQR